MITYVCVYNNKDPHVDIAGPNFLKKSEREIIISKNSVRGMQWRTVNMGLFFFQRTKNKQ